MDKLFILTQTDLYGMTPITDLHNLSLLRRHTHTHTRHNLLSILGRPSVSRPQHPVCTVNTIVQFWKCGLAENTERETRGGGMVTRGKQMGRKRTNQHLLRFSPKSLREAFALQGSHKTACLPDVTSAEHRLQTEMWLSLKHLTLSSHLQTWPGL